MIVLSTVAGERVRASNAIYGAAKAGLDGLAQGLGDAAAASGVRVLTVRPGFVTGRMTAGLKPQPMATTPDAVAEATVKALAGRAAHDLGTLAPALDLCFAEARASRGVQEAPAVTRNPLVIDVVAAVVIAALVLILGPGVGVAGRAGPAAAGDLRRHACCSTAVGDGARRECAAGRR